MIFLVGETGSRKFKRILREYGLGRMFVSRTPDPYEGEPWGFDNGAFACYLHGYTFDGDRFMRRLEKAYKIGTPYLAVVPDIVGRGLESLEFSLAWREMLPDDWPWYLAVQDGIKQSDVLPYLEQFDGIFLGGTNSYKRTCRAWCEFAHKHGKKFHFGRAGTRAKILLCKDIGADSADSAFPLWVEKRFWEVIRALKYDEQQLKLL